MLENWKNKIHLLLAFYSHLTLAEPSQHYSATDLIGSSPLCRAKNNTKITETPLGIKTNKCNLRRLSSAESLQKLPLNDSEKSGLILAQALKDDYFHQITTAFVEQAATVSSLQDSKSISKNSDPRLQSAITQATKACTKENASRFLNLQHKLEGIRANESPALEGLSKEQIAQTQEFLRKRTLIAILEISRIKRHLIDRALTHEQKTEMQHRLLKISEAYPFVSQNVAGGSLEHLVDAHYGNVLSPHSTKSHSKIDEILFPQRKFRVRDN